MIMLIRQVLVQQKSQLKEMADEYSAIFDEQLAAFEKERETLKQESASKISSLVDELKTVKEDRARISTELIVCKKQVSKSGMIPWFGFSL